MLHAGKGGWHLAPLRYLLGPFLACRAAAGLYTRAGLLRRGMARAAGGRRVRQQRHGEADAARVPRRRLRALHAARLGHVVAEEGRVAVVLRGGAPAAGGEHLHVVRVALQQVAVAAAEAAAARPRHRLPLRLPARAPAALGVAPLARVAAQAAVREARPVQARRVARLARLVPQPLEHAANLPAARGDAVGAEAVRGVHQLAGRQEHCAHAADGGGRQDGKHDDDLVARRLHRGLPAQDLAGHHAGDADHAHHAHLVQHRRHRGDDGAVHVRLRRLPARGAQRQHRLHLRALRGERVDDVGQAERHAAGGVAEQHACDGDEVLRRPPRLHAHHQQQQVREHKRDGGAH
mmetsp:Transcript_19885/g.50039  ORF Transcript_19885/g.50039 Transcript_19885/m.50039 type:complete len:349 (-) Transcript_19885:690-1736(-)